MKTKPQPLRLEATGRFLSLPLVGAHDNREPIREAVDRATAQLMQVLGH